MMSPEPTVVTESQPASRFGAVSEDDDDFDDDDFDDDEDLDDDFEDDDFDEEWGGDLEDDDAESQ